MQFVLTPQQMAAADGAAIEAGTPVVVLMERAGWALARSVRDLLGGTYGRRVALVCGKGNNGGDGLVAARVLEAWGVRTEVVPLDPVLDRARLELALSRADASVDAMYGTGFRGALDGDAAFAALALNRSEAPVVACDIPSGVDGLTGAIGGVAVEALVTVTFAAPKTGLLFEPGRSHAAVIRVVPIGIEVSDSGDRPAYLLDADDVGLVWPSRAPDTHKWAVGGLLVVAGSTGMLGAGQLVGRAALRCGAGMVHLAVPGSELAARASGSEVISRPLPETPEGFLDEPAAKEVLDGLDRFRALVIGPGLGTDERTVAAVRRIVAEAPIPLLVDADGLNALAGDLEPLRERSGPAVLTPHAGEFARLAGDGPGDDRLGAARHLAEECGAVVLLKGSTTVVAVAARPVHPRVDLEVHPEGGVDAGRLHRLGQPRSAPGSTGWRPIRPATPGSWPVTWSTPSPQSSPRPKRPLRAGNGPKRPLRAGRGLRSDAAHRGRGRPRRPPGQRQDARRPRWRGDAHGGREGRRLRPRGGCRRPRRRRRR
ncbi:MAG: hypothetical protein HYU28_02505, partial [Actinobacteria bacterium]|nr:hypothetical protein [Actinomycetota bacterium]